MSENLFNPEHKATNEKYREQYGQIKKACGCELGYQCGHKILVEPAIRGWIKGSAKRNKELIEGLVVGCKKKGKGKRGK